MTAHCTTSCDRITDLLTDWDHDKEGSALYRIVGDLFPICRSITGDGVRETLNRLRVHVDLTLHETLSGTPVFDWTVPDEWNIRDAYIMNTRGERVLDFRRCNLHVVSYSVPVRARMTLEELKKHIHTLPDTPDWIPYRTSYYQRDWGFCMAHRELLALSDPEYDVCVDSTIEPGRLTYGEFRIQGETDDEILISSHCCHPSLANDNLSGMAVAAALAGKLSRLSLRYSYRFLWAPGTIGAITWLATNESVIPRIRHGLVLSCLGDSGGFSYKRSRRGDAEIDHAVEHVLKHSGKSCRIVDYSPYGYDERQYCSPGFNLPVGAFTRTPNGKYPEYHTSADDLSLVSRVSLSESLFRLIEITSVLENNRTYLNVNAKCEPQLGRRGLYQALGGNKDRSNLETAVLWVLNLSDGNHSLLDISRRSQLSFIDIHHAAVALQEHQLLIPAAPAPMTSNP